MDENFPLTVNTNNKQQRCKEIFKILQHCYKYGAPKDNTQPEAETKLKISHNDIHDDCHQYKLLLKEGFNIVASTKREYIVSKLNQDAVLIKTTTRRLHDDEKEIEVKQETRQPEKFFADENHKIILVCGKTGTGKTTIINSMI
eukprot:440998_1